MHMLPLTANAAVHSPKSLLTLHDPGRQLVHWRRRAARACAEGEAMVTKRGRERGIDAVVETKDAAGLSQIVAPILGPPGQCPALRRDVGRLVRTFGALCGVKAVRVRLAVVLTQECTLFHVDNVVARLLVTYAGPGTEWLEEDCVHRNALWAPDLHADLDARNRRVARGAPRQAGPGDAVLMKCARWPGNERLGAVHRSPPVDGKTPRLKLTLDLPPDVRLSLPTRRPLPLENDSCFRSP